MIKGMEQASSSDAIRASLKSWRRRSEALAAERDQLVTSATEGGLIKEEIHQLTGLGRSTIDRILVKRGEKNSGR